MLLFMISTMTKIQAQNEFKPGYIILINGDTLKGLLQFNSNYELTNSVGIKENDQNEVIKYISDSVISFCFDDKKCYKSFKIEEKGRIVSKNFQYVIRGDISLFLLNEKDKTRIFILDRNNRLIELYETFVIDGNIKKSNHEYIFSLIEEMKDQPIICQKIYNLKFKINDIKKIVYEYNSIKNSESIEMFRINTKTNLTTIIYSGLSFYKDVGYRGGIDFKMNKPESYDYLSYHMGIYYRTNPYGQEKGDLSILFPITLEYRLGKKKTNPGLYFGWAPEFFTGFYHFSDERYFSFYGEGATFGVNYNFFIFDKIHLYTDLNYTAGAFYLCVGFGF